MKNKIVKYPASLFLFILGKVLFAQTTTYYEHIEPIILNNCVPCHNPKGIGPFNLLTFGDVSSKGEFIAHVTKIKYMPPWKADLNFQSFKNERFLRQEDIDLIQNWVASGMPKGRKRKGKVAEVTTLKPQPDMTLSMNTSFQIPNTAVEEFRFFSIPTNLAQDVYLSGIDFVPGSKQVHHSRIMADSTQKIRGINGLSEQDPAIKEFQKIPLADEFLYGWVPGNEGVKFPEGTGKKLVKGTDLILNIHYSPTSKEQQDKSSINLYFSKIPVSREVKTMTLRENDISNQPFFIPAQSQPTFYITYKVKEDISLISVLPHMHFLGKSFTALATTPSGETIPLIKIENWDFNWQSTYVYKTLLKIPAGSVILVVANYDNTSGNSANPYNPPKDAGYGWNSTDEMCNLIIYYVDYKEGDEKIKN
jgi:Copper type II ascorbate-dependent monooxygenase, C-terminal domain